MTTFKQKKVEIERIEENGRITFRQRKALIEEMEREKEEIDEIMEEMEAQTPKSSDKSKTFGMFQTPDDVDANRYESSGFFSSIFNKDPPKTKKPGLIYPSKPTQDKYYDYTNSNVGIAVIFNQIRFKGEAERKGSTKDAKDLREVLANMGFSVEICDDFTTKQIHEVLSERELKNIFCMLRT